MLLTLVVRPSMAFIYEERLLKKRKKLEYGDTLLPGLRYIFRPGHFEALPL